MNDTCDKCGAKMDRAAFFCHDCQFKIWHNMMAGGTNGYKIEPALPSLWKPSKTFRLKARKKPVDWDAELAKLMAENG